MFGGIGATFLWEHLLIHFKEVDIVVIGEGEHTFLKLVKCLASDRLSDLEKINGIAFRKHGTPVRTPNAEPIARLDDLPDPSQYFVYQHLALTRGCGGNCNFCGSPQFWGRKIRFHSAEYFVGQLERLARQGVSFFYFSDDTFTANKRCVIEVCRRILEKKLDISWNAISRADHVNEEVLYWMRKAGCIQISYGIESGSPKIRKFLLKNISTPKIQSAFASTQKHGIMARAYFIYGAPQESRQTIQETIDLMNRIKPLGAIFYILDIFPGTALYEDFKQRLNATDDICLNRIEDIMYFETDPALTREMILAFGQRLRSAFYENLPGYVEALQLIEDKELYPQHSSFYSRLALTFDHGDYSAIDGIQHKDRLVEMLYRRSLDYHPNAEAFLGLGIINPKKGAHREALTILTEGLSHFPSDVRLNICLGVGLMNLAQFDEALDHFLDFPHEKDAVHFAARCYEALGQDSKAAAFMKKFEKM